MTDTSPSQPTPDLVPLPGSEKAPAAGAQGAPSAATESAPVADATIEATIVLRRRGGGAAPAAGEPMDPARFAESFGADPADVQLASETFTDLGLTVLGTDSASRRMRVSGPTRTMETVFGTQLQQAAGPDGGTFRHRSGGLSVPRRLDGVVVGVLGLDDRPQSRAHFRLAAAQAMSVSYTPVQLGQVYDFPADTDGTGQTIAIIELGGGYHQSDLDTYFRGLGVDSPTVTAVGVDGAENAPTGDPNSADGEVVLDIEVAGALAPKADLVVYFAPNTDDGFLDAVAQAAHATPTPVAMSISWGEYEEAWTAQSRNAMNDAFADAVALGVTVTAAAGDDGSNDRATDGEAHADFPAASPNVLACGGTSLAVDSAGKVSSETVWNNGSGRGATGGGVSKYFPLPAYQRDAGVPAGSGAGGRGVPDVSAVADPATGYQVLVDGSSTVVGGTSAVAPLWAALVARLAQASGKPLGLAQTAFYQGVARGSTVAGFRDITDGNNGAYTAGPGWDACTGLGVPVGSDLLAALQGSQTSAA